MDELGAQVLPVETSPEWHITGSLLEGFNEPVYRFIPGITRSEGLFMCVLRKGDIPNEKLEMRNEKCKCINEICHADMKGAQPYSSSRVDLSYAQAMAYLRREALVLPADTPRGMVEVCFIGQPLGLVKNIGSRANNLYPKEWKIKTTHIPAEYETILRHT